MSILGAELITLRTFAAGSWDASGVFVPGASTDTTISGSVQPLEGEDREILPEGERHRDGIKVYTKSAVRPVDQYTAESAQHFIVDGVVYEIWNAKRWRDVIVHTKALALRVQES